MTTAGLIKFTLYFIVPLALAGWAAWVAVRRARRPLDLMLLGSFVLAAVGAVALAAAGRAPEVRNLGWAAAILPGTFAVAFLARAAAGADRPLRRFYAVAGCLLLPLAVMAAAVGGFVYLLLQLEG